VLPLTPENPVGPIAGQVAYHHADDLHDLRLWAQACALRAGLSAGRAGLLMLAVSELCSNTLLHTSGGGLVEVRSEAGGVVCEVTDDGPVGARVAGAMPQALSPNGRGLAIVEQVCDDVSIRAEGKRTVVRLWMKSG
jgi:serine/threonine-protein kinase RsbW